MKIRYVLCPEIIKLSYSSIRILMTNERIAAVYGVPWQCCISEEEARTIEGFRLIYLRPRHNPEEWLKKEIEGRNFQKEDTCHNGLQTKIQMLY